jgi:xanthine dehydrogenase FAD-binding subunit
MTRYVAATSIDHALDELAGGARILAGGTDLMVQMRRARSQGAVLPESLLDVTGLPELNRLEMDKDKPYVGAAVTIQRLERDETVRQHCPLLAQAAAVFGSVQIRTLATIGGNVANASPGADGLTALTALGARAEIVSLNGVRHVPLEELITGPNATTLAPGELVKGFELDRIAHGSVHRFQKIGRRRAVVIARMNLAICLDRDMIDPRVVLGACFPTPRRLTEVEKLFTSETPNLDICKEAGKIAAAEFSNACGWRESASYKLPAMSNLVAWTLQSAWAELGGVL